MALSEDSPGAGTHYPDHMGATVELAASMPRAMRDDLDKIEDVEGLKMAYFAELCAHVLCDVLVARRERSDGKIGATVN